VRAFQILLLSFFPLLIQSSYAFDNSEEISTRNLIIGCSVCHGVSGEAVGEMPALNGYNESQLIKKMKWFAKSPENGAVMHFIAKGYSETDLAKIAKFYAKKP
jgi:sulfide dehydrogenase cytochrome subunit|tara:strand:+ start:1294 stop:1602 length:309 start_codon:yes stop_codon:yes gene_type:complete